MAARFMILALRWAKKATKAGSMLAAAAFPFPDQPPPPEQLAAANRLDKDAESGTPQVIGVAPVCGIIPT
jgi:hypothetical protein